MTWGAGYEMEDSPSVAIICAGDATDAAGGSVMPTVPRSPLHLSPGAALLQYLDTPSFPERYERTGPGAGITFSDNYDNYHLSLHGNGPLLVIRVAQDMASPWDDGGPPFGYTISIRCDRLLKEYADRPLARAIAPPGETPYIIFMDPRDQERFLDYEFWTSHRALVGAAGLRSAVLTMSPGGEAHLTTNSFDIHTDPGTFDAAVTQRTASNGGDTAAHEYNLGELEEKVIPARTLVNTNGMLQGRESHPGPSNRVQTTASAPLPEINGDAWPGIMIDASHIYVHSVSSFTLAADGEARVPSLGGSSDISE